MKKILVFFAIFSFGVVCGQTLKSGDRLLDDAFALAVRTIDRNTVDSLLKAGGGYGGEWTRDISINSWNCVSLLRPDIARYSMWSVTHDRQTIGHQYWDKIIWVTAAYHHYLVTGDRDFYRQAYQCSRNTMRELEDSVYKAQTGLFTGPAVFQDGIAGYDEPIFDPTNTSSYVLDHHHSREICCLSTNCIYYSAYKLLAVMARDFDDRDAATTYRKKADALRTAIRAHLYDEGAHKLNYLLDPSGRVQRYDEGLGISFAVLFGVITSSEAHQVISRLYVSPHGLPAVYPAFPRYPEVDKPGRHNAIVWPFVCSFYAMAALKAECPSRFYFELRNLADLAVNKGKMDFYEIYNPVTGQPDGGWQCDRHWDSVNDQTWSATGYLRMVLEGIFGMRFSERGLSLRPVGLGRGKTMTLSGIRYRQADLTIRLTGRGERVKRVLINGRPAQWAFISAGMRGKVDVQLDM